jgi:plastocyanin
MKLNTLKPLAALVASVAMVLVVSSASAAQSTDVTIDNFAFQPAEVTVPVGSTLTWTNRQSAPHTTTSDTGVWDSGVLSNGGTFQLTLDQAGDFPYHCDVHPDMLGVVHVVADSGAPATDATATYGGY